jgi:hypothetical protein
LWAASGRGGEHLGAPFIGAISLLCVVLAATVIGVRAALREWPKNWIVFAIILLVIGQFAVALVLQVNWPAREGIAEHGYRVPTHSEHALQSELVVHSKEAQNPVIGQSESGRSHGFSELPTLRCRLAEPGNLGASGSLNPYPCARSPRHGHASALREVWPRICGKRHAIYRGQALHAVTFGAVSNRRSVAGLGAYSLSIHAHRRVPPNSADLVGKIEKLEQQIRDLSEEELVQLRRWFAEFDAEVWDRQIEADAAAGKLDRLGEKALRDHGPLPVVCAHRCGMWTA